MVAMCIHDLCVLHIKLMRDFHVNVFIIIMKVLIKHRMCVVHIMRLRAIHVDYICAPCFSRVFAFVNFWFIRCVRKLWTPVFDCQVFLWLGCILATITVVQFIVP